MPFDLKHSAKLADPWWYIFKARNGQAMIRSNDYFPTKVLAIRAIRRFAHNMRAAPRHSIRYKGKSVGAA